MNAPKNRRGDLSCKVTYFGMDNKY